MARSLFVDEGTCIGCALCAQIASKSFSMGDNGKSTPSNPPGDDEGKVQNAVDSCPVHAISWKEE